MTQDQKQKAKEIFIKVWNNPDIASEDLHTEIQLMLIEEEVIAPGSILTKESVRASYEKLGGDYPNYRKRPRVKNEGIVFDFSEPVVVETPVETPVYSRPDPVNFD